MLIVNTVVYINYKEKINKYHSKEIFTQNESLMSVKSMNNYWIIIACNVCV